MVKTTKTMNIPNLEVRWVKMQGNKLKLQQRVQVMIFENDSANTLGDMPKSFTWAWIDVPEVDGT